MEEGGGLGMRLKNHTIHKLEEGTSLKGNSLLHSGMCAAESNDASPHSPFLICA